MARRGRILVKCLGHGRDEAGGWHVDIGVMGEVQQHCIFSMEELASEPKRLWAFLGRAGYFVPQAQRSELLKKLMKRPEKETFKVLFSQGWHRGLFATPYRLYGARSKQKRVERGDLVDAKKWIPRGDLESWQTSTTEFCSGNPLLAFAVICAFMAPLLPLLHLATIGFSIVGDPSLGKSSALILAGSVWGGNPDSPLGHCETFLKTANAYDRVERRYRASLLCLDESHLAARSTRQMAGVVGDVVHRLASGQSKETAIDEALPGHSSLVYMMSSNYTIEQMFAMGTEKFDGSYTARLIEIPVSRPNGIFGKGSDARANSQLAQRIVIAAGKNYGVAIDRFLRRLVKQRRSDKARVVRSLTRWMGKMERRLKIETDAGGDARRGRYFCLAYAAGRLAARYGALPWDRSMIREAVEVAYAAHRQLIPKTTRSLNPVEKVRRFIEDHRGDFIDVRRRRPHLSDNAFEAGPGFVIESKRGQRYFAFAPKFFHAQFGNGDDAEPTLQVLKAAGLLKHDKGKLTRKHPIRANKDRDRVYCVRCTILGAARNRL